MKRGFTLIETVVTVGIVAAMAAVVIPQVAKQFDTADPTRVQNDLKNLQTAVETFNVNVKQLPGDLDDLANQIAVTEDSTLFATGNQATFTSTETPLWKGPYVDIAAADQQDDDVAIVTGFGALILDSFVCYSSGNNQHGVSDSTFTAEPALNSQTCPAVSGQTFLAFQMIGVNCDDASSSTTFMQINALFDGAAETSPKINGRVRCDDGNDFATNPDQHVVYFLAVPIS